MDLFKFQSQSNSLLVSNDETIDYITASVHEEMILLIFSFSQTRKCRNIVFFFALNKREHFIRRSLFAFHYFM